jgi:zinc transport system substrate-binding protein
MQKSFVIAGVILIAAVFAFMASQLGGAPKVPAQRQAEAKARVVATFYPLAEFARAVGGDAVEVSSIVPGGTEPHDYEPTPQDVAAIQAADVFLVNGNGLDAWAEKLRPELEAKGVRVAVMSEALRETNAEADGGSGGAKAADPHFWLDPVLARQEVQAIRDALVETNGAQGETYGKNTDEYLARLAETDTKYREGLASCRKSTVVSSHDALGYVAKRYGFTALSIAGLSPEEEPSPRRLAELTRTVRRQGVKYVFFETLVSPRLAETLVRETGAQTLVFDPIEGVTDEEARAGKNYLSIMEDNLKNLRTALECAQ